MPGGLIESAEARHTNDTDSTPPTSNTAVLSDKGAKVSEAYGSALDIPFLGRFSNRQTYIISPVRSLIMRSDGSSLVLRGT